ncbi:MAG: class I tRNA ligase family protein, partial [Patescibacteria group bacterium]|nr:class I tRNA ligase family protein [Patescibacteria group bacterium]
MYPFAKIEKKWAKKWLEGGLYELDLKKAKNPFYNLMMFPYPSAEGLHVGNVYAFIGSDVYGRLKRMKGYDVFEPIGLDGFGIHSENYALKVGKHPAEQAKVSEKRFYDQLRGVGNGFAWEKHLETYDVEYYKWTQWIFIQMWKAGLAYRKKASVNWCPSCKTVLADEQVINGECERCGTQVTKKELEQWFFEITKYAEKLLGNLDKIDWPRHIKTAQRNWIGKSEGWMLKFPIVGSKEKIEVFTTRADTILGATYMVLAPEHPLVERFMEKLVNKRAVKSYVKKSKTKTENDRLAEGRVKVGVELKGIKALNPVTGKEIPVWLSDYIIMSYGTGAIMAVPAYDERDKEFAKRYKLPVVKAKLIDPIKIANKIEGKKTTHYHLRDWLISRQRYWGPPIPMIFCE